MFTGIIEELGRVQSITAGSRSARLTIECRTVLEGVRLGDSIAVNGVCLTVTEFNNRAFSVDVMAETLKRSNLGNLVPGERVNLERALRLGDRLGGHLVSGHIDGVGTLLREEWEDFARVLEISAPPNVLRYTIEKGSIAVDGISLTVAKLTEKSFFVSLIPHTRSITTLGFKKIGDTVNLEGDIIGKYIERLMLTRQKGEAGRSSSEGLTMEFLVAKGFI